MRATREHPRKDARRRWTNRLARWLQHADETPERDEAATPTTAASQTMRETLSEPRD